MKLYTAFFLLAIVPLIRAQNASSSTTEAQESDWDENPPVDTFVPEENSNLEEVEEEQKKEEIEAYTPESWSDIEETGSSLEETEIVLPIAQFENGQESIIDTLLVNGKMHYSGPMLDTMNSDQLATDINDSQDAALKDQALHAFIQKKLSSETPNNQNESQIISLSPSNTQVPQGLNINLADLDRKVTVANWSGIAADSTNMQKVKAPTSLDPSNLSFIFQTGGEFAISKSIEAAFMLSSPYNILKVITISNEGPTSYKVSLQLQNDQELFLNASFIIDFPSSAKSWKISSFSYHFTDSGENLITVNYTNSTGNYEIQVNSESDVLDEDQYLSLGGYSLVPNISNHAQETKLKYLLIAGLNYVLSQGINNGALEDSIYGISQINSVYTRGDSTGNDILFRYDLDIANKAGKGARVKYEVFYALETQVQSYGFYYSI